MNATACPNHDTLEAYLLGNVSDAGIDAHLDECSDCQAALDQLDAAVNQPFECLRAPAGALIDLQQPTLQHLVTRAKAIGTVSSNGHAAPAGLPLPQTIGNYRLLELLSHSMNPVYKAYHQVLKKTVVVKLLSGRRSTETRRRFQREMEAVGRLASPHIVTAFDAGEIDGHDFLAMEHIEGEDFQQLVRKRGPLSIKQAIDCALQAARGLAHAHAAGIIHRDVKPGNLLLDASGTVKVLDLGLARIYSEDEEALGGVIMGTPAFMAPEQAIDTDKVDERADIYSLGCTLYWMLTGRAPYSHEGGLQLLAAHRDAPVPSLREARPDCPRALDSLFRRMLAKEPKDRPTSMKQVIAELERLQQPRRALGLSGVIAACVMLAASVLVAFALWAAGGGVPDRTKDKKDEAKNGVTMPKEGATPKIDMVSIPAGKFFMGSDSPRAKESEKPRREVKINHAFFLGKTEITQAQYEEVTGVNPSAFSKTGANKARVKDLDTSNHPVESVSWLDAVKFCNRLSDRHGLKTQYYKIEGEVVTIQGGDGYRLPLEAEWEYACRAGTTTTWYFGEKAEDLKEHAWFEQNSGDRTHPVAQKKANPWGLFDMYGNVPEWCWDKYEADYYTYMPASDPTGAKTSTRERAIRGDGWNARMPNTPAREGLGFTYGSRGSINLVGFRVARNAE